jgi:hypothetical protein
MKIMEDPYPETPGDRERTIAEAQAQIEAMQSLPQELRDALKEHASQLVERHRDTAPPNTHFYGGQLGWIRWVVRNDDMNLIAQLSPSALAITTYLTVAGSNPIVLAVGLILTTLAIAHKFKNKSISLDEQDYKLLMTLKHLGPSSLSGLTEALNGLSIYSPDSWTERLTLAALTKLKTARQADGSIVALVGESSDGLWSTNGI